MSNEAMKEAPEQQPLLPTTLEQPSFLDKTKVLKQRMFHQNTQLPENVQQAIKALSTLKGELQVAQKNLDRSIKIAENVKLTVDAYHKAVRQSDDIEMSKALQNMTASVAVGSSLTVFKDALKRVESVEKDIASLKSHRHSMDRYRRKSIKYEQGSNSTKIAQTKGKLSHKSHQYDAHILKIVEDVQVLKNTTATRHHFEDEILSAEFQVLFSLRVCLAKNHTVEGSKLYRKAWKSFNKRMSKLY